MALANKTTYEMAAQMPDKPKWWDVGVFVDCLQKLGQHEHLDFFRLDQSISVDTRKDFRNNPLLPTMLNSILDSARVKTAVKLPLAVRLDDVIGVKNLCKLQGIAVKPKIGEELTADARLLIYAAFNDQAKVVGMLLDAGFDVSQLDGLIALELQRALDEKQIVSENEPPPHWVKQQLAAGVEKAVLKTRWAKLPMDAAPGQPGKMDWWRALTWDMLPHVAGWTFKVDRVEGTDGRQLRAGNDGSDANPGRQWPRTGLVLQQVKCCYRAGYWRGNGAVQEREFFVCAPEEMRGQRFHAVDEVPAAGRSRSMSLGQSLYIGRQVAGRAQTNQESITCIFEQDGCTWRASLTPQYKDNMTAWLPMDSDCRFRFPVGLEGRLEKNLVQESFFHWLRKEPEQSDKDPHEWEAREWESDEDHPHPNFQMDELHRIYWAIRTNRSKLAEVLIRRCRLPIVAGLFAAYIFRKQALPKNFIPDTQLKTKHMPLEMRRSSERYACEILDHADFQGSLAAFDEYVFWGTDEEDGPHFKRFKRRIKDRRENANVRAALMLMNQDSVSEITNIDLALAANSKVFMGQAGVTQFLNTLWKAPSNNGNFTDAWMSRRVGRFSSPRYKCYYSIVGYLAFMALYISVVLSMPGLHENLVFTGREVVFWGWEFVFILREISEATDDFDSFRQYLRGSGNALDLVIISVFVTAFFFRLLISSSGAEDAPGWMAVMLGLLCLDLVLCSFRLVTMLRCWRPIGITTIITTKSKGDAFLKLVLVCEPVSADTKVIAFSRQQGRLPIPLLFHRRCRGLRVCGVLLLVAARC